MTNEEFLTNFLNHFISQKNNSSTKSSRSIRFQGLTDERKAAKLILDYLKSKGYIFYRLKGYSIKKPMEIQDEKKFYSRKWRALYIYVKNSEDFLDLDLFPNELGLFGPESAWSIKEKMAIVEDAEEWSLNRAEAILQENGFKRREHPENLLVNYFALGDFSIFTT